MPRLICLSSGLTYRLENNRNKMIDMLEQFQPDGVELNFPTPELLLNFSLTKRNIKFLGLLKWVSAHLPWVDISYGKNDQTQKIIKKITQLSKKLHIDNLVVHPLQVKNFKILADFNLPVSIENEDPKMPGFFIPNDFKKIFKNNPELHFNFDFAHAGLVSDKNIDNFIANFKNKTIEIHLSSLKKGDIDHWFLKPFDSAKNCALISKLKQIKNAAIVFECVAKDFNDLKKTKAETTYIKNLLS